MNTDVPKGKRFSHIYARPMEPIKDSKPMRVRVHKLIGALVSREDSLSFKVGSYIDRELGTDNAVPGYMGSYYDWDVAVVASPLNSFLDLLTVFHWALRQFSRGALPAYGQEINRIFREEFAPYTMDDEGGLHPFVDSAALAGWQSAIRGLEGSKYTAARKYIEAADDALLASDGRRAIKDIFDAAENVFKQLTGTRQLSYPFAKAHLEPMVSKYFSSDQVLKQSSEKALSSFYDWISACHDYRHEGGQEIEAQPDESHAILLVTQGLSFVRWLADIARREVLSD